MHFRGDLGSTELVGFSSNHLCKISLVILWALSCVRPACCAVAGVEPSSPFGPGFIFPMISAGGRISPDKLFLHHASPLALRPATRMAAGLHFLKW